MANEPNVPEVILMKSEIEAAAARVAERAMNTTLDGVAGVVADVFGGWFGDGIKQWRTRRLIDALVKTKEHLEAAGIPIENAKALPMGEAYAIFEGCSKQEDTTLTDLWAALLANAMNPSKETFIDPSFTRALANMSGLDARILRYIDGFFRRQKEERDRLNEVHARYADIRTLDDPRHKQRDAETKQINDRFVKWSLEFFEQELGDFSSENISFSVSNLLRMGLISYPEQSIPRDLVQVKIHRGRDMLVADDSRLSAFLRSLRDQAGAVIEKQGKVHQLVTDSSFMGRVRSPVYRLSGFGRRLLDACSV